MRQQLEAVEPAHEGHQQPTRRERSALALIHHPDLSPQLRGAVVPYLRQHVRLLVEGEAVPGANDLGRDQEIVGPDRQGRREEERSSNRVQPARGGDRAPDGVLEALDPLVVTQVEAFPHDATVGAAGDDDLVGRNPADCRVGEIRDELTKRLALEHRVGVGEDENLAGGGFDSGDEGG